MTNDNTNRHTNKGMSLDMYQYISQNVNKLKSINLETGVVETAKNTNGYVCSSTGYLRVKLGEKTIPVHSVLAALRFKEKCIGKQVNHKNGDKLDNSIHNLEVVTQAENIKHEWDTGLVRALKGSEQPNSKLTPKQVVEIRSKHTPFKKKGSGTITSLSKEYGVSKQTISAVVSFNSYVDVMG